MGKIILGEIELTPQQEVETVSGNVETLSSTTTAHTADTTAHVTAADKTKWNTVDDKLDTTAYTPTDLSNYYTKSQTSGASEISTALSDKSDTGHTHSQYLTSITSSQVTTALGFTPADNADLTAHTADTTAHVTQELLDRINSLELFLGVHNGHAFIEVGGIKWATMNIGATSVTDAGLYFQWGDTSGYTASQVGSGSGQKYFDWGDYKYSRDPSGGVMTKYNSSDGLTELDASDDAAAANWGGNWRMPTTAEYQALLNATTTAWTSDYQGSGVSGFVLTDKTDSTKVLFFPAAGYCEKGSITGTVYYWECLLDGSRNTAAYHFGDLNMGGNHMPIADAEQRRYWGMLVRGVVG